LKWTQAQIRGDEKLREEVDNDVRKAAVVRFKRKEALLIEKDKEEIVDIMAKELVSVENKVSQEIKTKTAGINDQVKLP
jgi:hypothetical protein